MPMMCVMNEHGAFRDQNVRLVDLKSAKGIKRMLGNSRVSKIRLQSTVAEPR